MKIAICDDVEAMAIQLEKIVSAYMRQSNQTDIDIYTKADGLVRAAAEYDIIFLDIEMPEMDGIEAGRRIRSVNPAAYIIVASGIPERFKETYEIDTLRFVTKPYDSWEVEKALEAVEKRQMGMQKMCVYRQWEKNEILQKDITYIEAYDGYALIRTAYESFRRDISLERLSEELDGRMFFRIHRKYIINMKRVTEYRDGSVNINERWIKVSRDKRRNFEKAWYEFGF